MLCMGKLIEDKITLVSEAEASYALREAWKRLYDKYPSVDSLALLWAQWALESGRGKFCHLYNFGNIKKQYKPDDGHDWCMFRCSEILNGKEYWFNPPHIQTHFRAYQNSTDGAYDYITFLSKRKRYLLSWEQVKKGDASAFVHELKKAGYFTADEERYKKAVVKLTEEFKKKYSVFLLWKPTTETLPKKETEVDDEVTLPNLKLIVPEASEPSQSDYEFKSQPESFWSGFISFLKKLFGI